MITATEARKKSGVETIENILDRIGLCIERATKKKETRIVYMLDYLYNNYAFYIVEELKALGYIVSANEREKGLTELIISWR